MTTTTLDTLDTQEYATFTAALKASGLDFEPEQHTVYLPNGLAVPDCQAIVRSDTGAPLGITGSRHVPEPYAKTAAALDARGPDGALTDYIQPEGMLSFKGGAQAIFRGTIRGGMARIRSPRTGEDAIALHLNATTAVDGSLGRRMLPSGHRVVCRNTLAMAMAQDVWRMKTKHTAGGHDKFVGFVNAVRASLARFHKQAEVWQGMANTRVNDAVFKAYAENVLAGQGVEGVLAAIEARPVVSVLAVLDETEAATNPSKALEAVLEAYEAAPGAEPGTVWGAYQAITHYYTHTAGRSEETRAHSLLLGPNGQRVAVAEQVAVRLAAR